VPDARKPANHQLAKIRMFSGMRCLTLARVGYGKPPQADVSAGRSHCWGGLSLPHTPGNNYGPDEFTEQSPLAVAFFCWRVPEAPPAASLMMRSEKNWNHMQAAKMTPGGNAKMAISATQLTLFFTILRYFSRLHRTNFSQIPQRLFTELIGLALLFSLPADLHDNLGPHDGMIMGVSFADSLRRRSTRTCSACSAVALACLIIPPERSTTS
jgi:hypothetical protein